MYWRWNIANIFIWINIFNINQLLRVSIFVILVFNSKKLIKVDTLFYLKIKIYAVSLILLPLLQTFPLLSGRLSELVGTVIILLLPNIIFCFKRIFADEVKNIREFEDICNNNTTEQFLSSRSELVSKVGEIVKTMGGL